MHRILISFICLLSLAACMPTTSVNFLEKPNLETELYDGKALIVSDQLQTKVYASSASQNVESNFANNKYFEIFIMAENKSHKPFILSTENIKVQVSGEDAVVQTYEKRQKEIKTKAGWAAFSVALSSAANAYAASMPTYTTGSYNSYGTSGTFSATTYNSSANAIANAANTAQTNAQMSSISQNLKSGLSDLTNSYLKPTKMKKKMSYGGKFRIKTPTLKKGKTQKIRMIITLGSETHKFEMERAFDPKD